VRIFRGISGFMLGLGLAAASVGPGHADVAKIGILSCDVSKGVGEILSRKQSLTCQFRPDGGVPEIYTGKIDEYGLEIGKVVQGHLIWGVASATRSMPQGALAGKYVGVGADAALGVGLGANALVGGNKQSVSLQPLSVDGETGINIAIGVVRLTLAAAN
jgi:hypothetical protein